MLKTDQKSIIFHPQPTLMGLQLELLDFMITTNSTSHHLQLKESLKQMTPDMNLMEI